jgi:hypothetical protein
MEEKNKEMPVPNWSLKCSPQRDTQSVRFIMWLVVVPYAGSHTLYFFSS